MSLSNQELKLRVDAKINELKAQLGNLAADGTAEAQKRKEQIEATLKDAQAHIKEGWEKLTDQASSKLNEWLKG
jgi:DNA replication initiation complex subunit (GINS family)